MDIFSKRISFLLVFLRVSVVIKGHRACPAPWRHGVGQAVNLRKSPTEDAVITVNEPKGIFRLSVKLVC